MAQHTRLTKALETPAVKVIASKFESKPVEEQAVQRPIDPNVTIWPPVKVTADAVLLAAAAAQAPAKNPKRLDPVLSSSSRTPVKEAAHQVLAAGELEKNRRVIGLAVMEAAKYASGRELPVKAAAAHHEEVIAAHRVVAPTPVPRRGGPPNSAPGREGGGAADAAADPDAAGSESPSVAFPEPPRSSPAAIGRRPDDGARPAAQPDVGERREDGIAPIDGRSDMTAADSGVCQAKIEEMQAEGTVSDGGRGKSPEKITSVFSLLPDAGPAESFENATSIGESDDSEPPEAAGAANILNARSGERLPPSATEARLRFSSRSFFTGSTAPESTRPPLPNIVDIVSAELEAAEADPEDDSSDDDYDELFGDGLDILDLAFTSRRRHVASAASAAKSVVEHDAFIIEEDDVRAAIERAEEARLRHEGEEKRSREESMRRSQFRKGEVYLV
ncbi:MAG: hypothetical protein BJ554DRAFT_5502 [Olpidium bornovanus]|uniref:Uncharacterized protein n=1 Tax=Olpidium bornovanus TaxID=278681 RepID=A0A8H8A054_9FUNG|nr:MAG: hypothetical protein BJ554DRAFT_5502 [Olpidium bornovanus]